MTKLTLLLILLYTSSYLPRPLYAANVPDKITKIEELRVTASIGENMVTIFGYTGPRQKVELESYRVYAQVYSDATGYFEFKQALLPKNPSELCLTSIDSTGRRTSPSCIAPPPSKNYSTDIGPILLSPTLSLTSSSPLAGSEQTASGVGIPNSSLQISLFQEENTPKLIDITAQAADWKLPQLTIQTDSEGNFSLNLPTTYENSFKVFAKTLFQSSPSPKSPTLSYSLAAPISLLLLKALQILLLVCIFPLLFITIKKKKHPLPVLYEKQLVCQNYYPPSPLSY